MRIIKIISKGVNSVFRNSIKDDVFKRTHRFLGGAGVTYFDYIANHQIIYDNYYGGPTEYYGYGNKMGIGGTKNMFMWLMFGYD